MNTSENKAYRRLILEINSAKTQTQLWKADRNVRQFIDKIAKNNPDEAQSIANELYNISITRHNNLIKWNNERRIF